MSDHAYDENCPHCRELRRKVAELEALNASLKDKLAAATKTSANSSKPPSSDLVKPTSPNERRKNLQRKIGAQPGHQKHERPPVPSEQIDDIQEHRVDVCSDCGGEAELLEQPAATLQQIELVAKPIKITEHRSRVCRCAKCEKNFVAPIPAPVQKAGLSTCWRN